VLKRRRDFLKALSALSCLGLSRAAWPDQPAAKPVLPADNFCGSGEHGSSLFIPGDSGLFGRLAPDGAPLTMRAGAGTGSWPLGYTAEHEGKRFVNPTLVLRSGERVRIAFENALSEPSIVHWHGLTIDSRNDGSGLKLVPAGEKFAYDFELRDRAGLYWYHPHPHGATAGQTYRGLFGMIAIDDADERALRAALDLVPGRSEIPLLLQDRRSAGDYVASADDQMHGFLGDSVLINGSTCPHLDVATRIYRFRVLNASNARNYRLAFRSVAGKPMPFLLIGSDDGLIPSPQPCDEAFLAPAERLDLLLDLSGATVGDTLYLETRAFDPMHMEMAGPAGSTASSEHAAMGHDTTQPDAPMDHATMDHSAMDHSAMDHPGSNHAAMDHPGSNHAAMDHSAMSHGGAFPEGAARALLELRVRERSAYSARVPSRLCSLGSIDPSGASERPLRLGFAKGRWRINDRVFAMGETPIEVKRGSVETWLIRNYFNSMPHAMHLHGFHFEVLERQTSPDQLASLRIDPRGRFATDLGRKDTVLVWPGETVRVAVDFSLPSASAFAGDQIYMFHCHNLEHEDGGMMLGVRVT
jgi:FtsP/CotA-like multicopper oxidase with cupredoxin domain